jgi:hypothetical protein
MEISLTELIEAGRCYRKLQYTCDWKIQGREVNVPLRFGGAIHSGLGALYDSGSVEEAYQKYILASQARPFEDLKGLRTASKAEELIRAYDQYIYRVMDWEDTRGEHEFRVTLPVRDTSFDVLFHPDREGFLNGAPSIMEWKTSEKPGNFVSKPNEQLVGYAWAKREVEGITVHTIFLILLGIYKTSVGGVMKTRRKAGEPDSEPEKKLVVDPDYVPIEEWELENFQKNLTWKLGVLYDVMQMEEWPQETANCWNCEFKPLCACSKEERQVLRETQYYPREGRMKI